MSTILIIDTATPVCSVALTREGRILARRDSERPNDHAALLAIYIAEILKESALGMKELQAVAVSKGPGSYTGLRIGTSMAKGLCYSLGIPLIALDTLEGMAHGLMQVQGSDIPPGTLLCPMIDARRMEVYCAVFNTDIQRVEETRALIIDVDTFGGLLHDQSIILFGDGAAKTESVLGSRPNLFIERNFIPSASHFIRMAEQAFSERNFEDSAYFEPYYLKDFIAGKPHVKGLR